MLLYVFLSFCFIRLWKFSYVIIIIWNELILLFVIWYFYLILYIMYLNFIRFDMSFIIVLYAALFMQSTELTFVCVCICICMCVIICIYIYVYQSCVTRTKWTLITRPA